MRTTRRPDWLLAIGMCVGGLVPCAALFYLAGPTTWAAVVSGLIFWPCAFAGGCIALIGEDVR